MQHFLESPIVTLHAGTKAEQGNVLLQLLQAIDLPFTMLARSKPLDERPQVPGITRVRDLVARYKGDLTDQRAEALFDEFLALKGEFLESLRGVWGARPDDDMAWTQRLGDRLGAGNEEMLANFEMALRGSDFAHLLAWLRILLETTRGPISQLMPLLADSGNEYSAGRLEGASAFVPEMQSAGGWVKAANAMKTRREVLAKYDQWQTGKRTKSGFIAYLSQTPGATQIVETQLYKWLRERGRVCARIKAETECGIDLTGYSGPRHQHVHDGGNTGSPDVAVD